MPENKIESDKNTRNVSGIVIELHYFPPVSYFKQISIAPQVFLEAFETFQKQTFRNRCEIVTPDGIEPLIVPVLKNNGNGYIRDVKIDYSQRWQAVHERSIRSAYGKSPFFDFFIEDFCLVWSKRHSFLWDLNEDLLTLCLKMLRIKKEVHLSKGYFEAVDYHNQHILDLRGKIQPNVFNEYRQNGIKVYPQIFGNDFAKDVSIIDLLFCAALDSSEILK